MFSNCIHVHSALDMWAATVGPVLVLLAPRFLLYFLSLGIPLITLGLSLLKPKIARSISTVIGKAFCLAAIPTMAFYITLRSLQFLAIGAAQLLPFLLGVFPLRNVLIVNAVGVLFVMHLTFVPKNFLLVCNTPSSFTLDSSRFLFDLHFCWRLFVVCPTHCQCQL